MASRLLQRGLFASIALGRTSSMGTVSRLPMIVSLRYASALAAQRKEQQASPSLAHGVTQEPLEAQAVGTDQPAFTTLHGRVSEHTLAAITNEPMRLTHMSAVQTSVLPLLPELARPYNPEDTSDEPRDLLVKARTGTGKTLAFLVPAIEARLKYLEEKAAAAVQKSGLDSTNANLRRAIQGIARDEVGTLIISPTRELATQICKEAQKLTSHHGDFEVKLFVGGVSKRAQTLDWRRSRRRDIVVGTPGRLRDILENEPDIKQALEKTQVLILDEADTLLEMGFRQEIEAITDFLPPTPQRQTFLFSATVSPAIQQVARNTLAKNHRFINCVAADASPVHAHVPQYHTILSDASEQLPHVLRLLAHDQLANPGKSKTIIFLPTTKMTQLFTTFLQELSSQLPAGRKTRVFEIHSGRSQEARTRTSNQFRADKSGASILASSDVSARGVDYPGVTRVIQIGIPSNADQYVHRVGRTGRGTDKFGRADLVLLPWEFGFVNGQLSRIPLKPLTVKELDSQVSALAERYEADPTAFLRDGQFVPEHKSHRPFAESVTSRLTEIQESLRNLQGAIDEDAVKQTLASMLGYYVGKASEIRVAGSSILEGLREWTVGACGLEKPPYISETLLKKIGISGSSSSRSYPDRQRGQRSTRFGRSSSAEDRSFPERQGDRSFPERQGDRFNKPYSNTRDRSYPDRERQGSNYNGISDRNTYPERRPGYTGRNSHSRDAAERPKRNQFTSRNISRRGDESERY